MRPAACLANLKPPWTPETAREAAARSNAAQAVARFNRPAASLGQLTQLPPDDDYAAQILARTRKQLDLVAQSILDELAQRKPDSRRLRDLSDAQRHLAEQERILAGRPLPGSRRPKDHEPHSSQPGAWIDVQPVEQPGAAPASAPRAIEPPKAMGWEYDDPAQPSTPPPPPS